MSGDCVIGSFLSLEVRFGDLLQDMELLSILLLDAPERTEHKRASLVLSMKLCFL